jgi:hypothetical protein
VSDACWIMHRYGVRYSVLSCRMRPISLYSLTFAQSHKYSIKVAEHTPIFKALEQYKDILLRLDFLITLQLSYPSCF